MNPPLGVTEFGMTFVVPGGNFRWHEFAMKPKEKDRAQWGVYHDVPEELRPNAIKLVTNVLQPLRAALGRPLTITGRGGWRPADFNRWSRGAKHSQHVLCKAADLQSTVSPERVHKTLLLLWAQGVVSFGGLGAYATFTHVDIRDIVPGKLPKRWSGRGVND